MGRATGNVVVRGGCFPDLTLGWGVIAGHDVIADQGVIAGHDVIADRGVIAWIEGPTGNAFSRLDETTGNAASRLDETTGYEPWGVVEHVVWGVAVEHDSAGSCDLVGTLLRMSSPDTSLLASSSM